jgi:hypothetical protein
VLGDMNGDKLTDVAIGAPGEQENRGAVYIFHGVSGLDIGLVHSQVRPCLQLLPCLWFTECQPLSFPLATSTPYLLSVAYFLEYHQIPLSTNHFCFF